MRGYALHCSQILSVDRCHDGATVEHMHSDTSAISARDVQRSGILLCSHL